MDSKELPAEELAALTDELLAALANGAEAGPRKHKRDFSVYYVPAQGTP